MPKIEKGFKITSAVRKEIEQIVDEKLSANYATKADVDDLKQVVKLLVEAQKELTVKVSELAEAQRRTEERLNELGEAQRRTEERLNEFEKATEENFRRVW
ncbi:MAG: hypothetical protein ACK44H_08165, partial [Candidatus Kryptonium sp.]